MSLLSSVLDQVDVGEVEDESDRAAVVGQGGQDLVGDLAGRSFIGG